MPTAGAPKISRREAEVLAGIGAYLANTEIAAALGISVRTVESHVSALLRKFRCRTGGPWPGLPRPSAKSSFWTLKFPVARSFGSRDSPSRTPPSSAARMRWTPQCQPLANPAWSPSSDLAEWARRA
ncbi:response regulator transcription factor [Catenulispora sp. GAS73]|uniref:response regulator transcription factor n=1 Tax=Catenulispora sp. GAS73 TaxID=3156269 RepID=UPI003513C835